MTLQQVFGADDAPHATTTSDYVSATKTAHELRRKRLVPLASMDPMEGVEIGSFRDKYNPRSPLVYNGTNSNHVTQDRTPVVT